MKNILIIAVVVIAVIGILSLAEKRDEKLMELCADHNTKTLYECK